jgi:diguanylate cyclase (GGDEF)-like protein/PAS domain S-box-containing protein
LSAALFAAVSSLDPRLGGWLVLGAGLLLTVLWARSTRVQEEKTFRHFVEGIEEGFFFYRHDRARSFHYLSPSVTGVLGYRPQEFRAAAHDIFTDHALNVAGRTRLLRTLAGEAQAGVEVEVRHKDGTPRRLEITEYPVFGRGDEVVYVEGIAHDVTETRRLHARLQELATRDELSGIFNRRHFRERLQEAVGLARRHKHALSLALLDLDGLKTVNDTHGHAAGDAMIRAAAGVLSRELRRGDVVGRLDAVPGRLGGDEFGAILPYSPTDGAMIAVQRVLAAFAAARVQVAEGVFIPLAASVGVAELTDGLDLDTLEVHADAALYRAKRGGRGRVEVWAADQTPA